MALGNLAQRALVAVIALPLLFLGLYQRIPEITWVIVFIASGLAMRELFAMTLTRAEDRRASMILGLAACAALYWLHPDALRMTHKSSVFAMTGPLVAMALAVIAPALYYLFRFHDMTTVAVRFAYTVLGIVYVGLLMSFLGLIKRDFGPSGGDFVVLVLVIAWAGDTGAYFAGRFLGKGKLYEAVSPKKTWAGAWGGLIASVAGAAAMKLLRLPQLPWLDVFLMAAPAAALGQMGDLAESMIKRSVGVKDSGALLPGHGGMLDRLDAVLFIGPYIYLYVMIRPAIF